MSTLTTHFNFYQPAQGDGIFNGHTWGLQVNDNFELIDSLIWDLSSGKISLPAGGSNGNVLTLVAGIPTWGPSAASPMTAIGDMIVGGSEGVSARLGIGTDGQVLTVASGIPAWEDPASGLPASTTSDNGKMLTVVAGVADWATFSGLTNPMTTAGDIILATSGGTPARLGVGTNGQVLTVVSGVPTWLTFGTSGAWSALGSPSSDLTMATGIFNTSFIGTSPNQVWRWSSAGAASSPSFTNAGNNLTGWTVNSVTILSTGGNPGYCLNANGGQYAKIDLGFSIAGCTIAFDSYSSSGSALPGFVYGADTNGNGYLCLMNYLSANGGMTAQSSGWANANGVGLPRLSTGTWHHVVIVVNNAGTSATLTVDGTLLQTLTGMTLKGTWIGIGNNNSSAQFDNIAVTRPALSNVSSPLIEWEGNVNNGGNGLETWAWQVVIPSSGTNPDTTLALTHPSGTSGKTTMDLSAINKVKVATLGIGTVGWVPGAGSPEGVLAAPVGSLYTRTDGGAGSTLYVKESGTGNTGWVGK